MTVPDIDLAAAVPRVFARRKMQPGVDHPPVVFHQPFVDPRRGIGVPDCPEGTPQLFPFLFRRFEESIGFLRGGYDGEIPVKGDFSGVDFRQDRDVTPHGPVRSLVLVQDMVLIGFE